MRSVNDPAVWSALDGAWSDAVKLPQGWRLRSIERNGTEVTYTGGRKEYVEWWEARARGPEDQEIVEVGSWPVHSLAMLVEKLAEVTMETPDAADKLEGAMR